MASPSTVYYLPSGDHLVFVKFAVESVCNNPSYHWFLQFDSWSISAVCLYFILSTLLLIYYTIKTWRENKNKENVETKHKKTI